MIFEFLSILSVQSLMFILLWFICLNFARISWVDVFWSASIGLWSCFHLFENTPANSLRSKTFLVLMFLWSLRLSYYLTKRLILKKGEDRRYEEIKNRSIQHWSLKSFFIFLMNALLASFLVLLQRIIVYADNKISLIFLVGATLSFFSILLEQLADSQLQTHLKLNSGKTLQSGLWKYSRHPNYFFEWLFWVGAALMCFDGEHRLLALGAPTLMFIFLNYFTGVKISEQGALLRRKDFGEYQKRTSAFFLFPPRKDELID